MLIVALVAFCALVVAVVVLIRVNDLLRLTAADREELRRLEARLQMLESAARKEDQPA